MWMLLRMAMTAMAMEMAMAMAVVLMTTLLVMVADAFEKMGGKGEGGVDDPVCCTRLRPGVVPRVARSTDAPMQIDAGELCTHKCRPRDGQHAA